MKSVRIDKGRTVPIAFSFIGTFLLFLSFNFMFEHLSILPFSIIGILISPILPIMWTTRKILEINPNEKYVFKFIWMMGRKFGKRERFERIEKLYVSKVRLSQRMTTTPEFHEYIGFILLSNEMRMQLVRDKEKDFVFEKMNKIAGKLNMPLLDPTESQESLPSK